MSESSQLEKFIQDAKIIIEKNDNYAVEILRVEVLKLLKEFIKQKKYQLCWNRFLIFYYKLIQNSVYQQLNQTNIELLIYEIDILEYLKHLFHEESLEKIDILIKILENTFYIHFLRKEHQLINSNIGRKYITNSQLLAIEDLKKDNAALKKSLENLYI